MANVSVELTSSVSTVQVDAMGSDSTFDVLVCGTFGGPGLTNRSLSKCCYIQCIQWFNLERCLHLSNISF